MLYTDEMFNSQSESTTLTDMNSGSTTTPSTYAAKIRGRLVKVILLWSGEAVTSLFEYCRVELSATVWSPNLLKVGLVGAGIRTAPAVPIAPAEWPIDQPVVTDQPITGQVAYDGNATPVTCNLRVFGVFSTT